MIMVVSWVMYSLNSPFVSFKPLSGICSYRIVIEVLQVHVSLHLRILLFLQSIAAHDEICIQVIGCSIRFPRGWIVLGQADCEEQIEKGHLLPPIADEKPRYDC